MFEETLYHGTFRGSDVLSILNSGKILSPWAKVLEEISQEEERVRIFYGELARRNEFASLEDYALYRASNTYGVEEIEKRVKCVSLARTLEQAETYATKGSGSKGAIFEIDYEGLEVDGFQRVVFVPREVTITNRLRNLYLFEDAECYEEIRALTCDEYGINPIII